MTHKELREEFYDFGTPTIKGKERSDGIESFYPRRTNQEIADFWLSHMQAEKDRLVEEVEGLKEIFIDQIGTNPIRRAIWSDEVLTIIKQQHTEI